MSTHAQIRFAFLFTSRNEHFIYMEIYEQIILFLQLSHELLSAHLVLMIYMIGGMH